MRPREEERIRKWNGEVSGDIRIGLLVTGDKRSRELSEFCENLARLAPKIRIVKEEGEPKEAPAIRISSALRYHAVPLGTELEPFLEALSASGEKSSLVPEHVRDQLEKIELPAGLRLYVSRQCPFCPVTVRQIVPLLAANELVRLAIIDCDLFAEMAQLNGVRSVPTLLLDEQFRWTGQLHLEEVVEVITNRDPAKLGASSLQRMLREGNAVRLAEMMLDKEDIFPAFVDLLTHEKWPVRLGAMVAMEEISGRNRQLAARVIGPLWERFDHAGDTVKGDIIYILGESGDRRIAPRLEVILAGEYDAEVKEAAKEALEKIVKQ
ncbi:MAG: thioredoxin family protein [Desulfobacterales bacterium]|nr:thioredoxin family protein [Desulfobacterales bacterium]